LEVYRATGQPLSHRQTQFDDAADPADCKVFVLEWPREQLHQRIDDRVDAMFTAGLVDEVQTVLARFGKLSRTAGQAVGYQEVIDHLNGGQDLEEAIQKVKNRTHRFARRQETWFRSLEECRWLPQQDEEPPEEVAAEIFRLGNEPVR
jgi:tRNA dimethylallyltransferase